MFGKSRPRASTQNLEPKASTQNAFCVKHTEEGLDGSEVKALLEDGNVVLGAIKYLSKRTHS